MPLVTTKNMFEKSMKEHFAIGAFNVNNMEIIQGIVDAAAEENAPVILQASSSAIKYARINYLMKMVEAAVEEHPNIPIAIHLDHGPDFETCKMCVDNGFTSVMFDGSKYDFEENIRLTKEVVDYAHAHGVVVEAELGKLAEKYITIGQLVPDDVTVKVVEERLNEPDVENGIILDGFPRTVKQAEELDRILAKKGKKVDKVINLTTPDEEIIERIVNRRVCSNQECKAVYNLILNPPKKEGICDKCGSELIIRKDDTEETVKARLKTYFEQTSPLVEYYEKQNIVLTELVSKSVNKLGKDVADEITRILK